MLVVDQAFIDSGKLGDPANWVETKMDGSQRKNYAGIGYKYDVARDAFIAPKPKASATLDETTAKWIVPTLIKDNTASQ